MTRPVSEHDQPHIRSPFMTAAPTSRLRRARLRKTRTILESGVSGHGLLRFVYLDPPFVWRCLTRLPVYRAHPSRPSQAGKAVSSALRTESGPLFVNGAGP